MFKKITLMVTAVVLAGLMATPISAHRKASPTVTVVGLSLRTCASTSCHKIRVIPAHKRVKVRGCHRRWCKVSYRGHSGFVAKRFLRKAGHSHHRRNHKRRYHNNGIQFQFQFGL